eukprot:scaffold254_cov124-Skeletonema_marinoi.AAC.4
MREHNNGNGVELLLRDTWWTENAYIQLQPSSTFAYSHLQVSLAKILSFSQTKLHEQFSSRTGSSKLNSSSDYVHTKWQQHYNVPKVKVNWDFEFVDINMRISTSNLLFLRNAIFYIFWREGSQGSRSEIKLFIGFLKTEDYSM